MKYQQRKINLVDAVRLLATPDTREPEFNEPTPKWVKDAVDWYEYLILTKKPWGDAGFYVWEYIVDIPEFDTFATLLPGQWLVLHDNGNMSVWDNDVFEETFMPINKVRNP